MKLKAQKEMAAKTMFAAIGAPVVTGRKAWKRVEDLKGRVANDARSSFDEWADEGKKLTDQLQDGKFVEEMQDRMDLDQLQSQVGKFRGQLETALANWREGFTPASAPTKTPAADKKPDVKKVAAKKAPAKTVAAKQVAAKKAPSKKVAGTKAAAKKTPAKKAPAAKAGANK